MLPVKFWAVMTEFTLSNRLKPVRHETERPEAVEAGTVKLAGVDEDTIFEMASQLLSDKAAYDKMAKAVNPYGAGRASERIADALIYHFLGGKRPQDLV